MVIWMRVVGNAIEVTPPQLSATVRNCIQLSLTLHERWFETSRLPTTNNDVQLCMQLDIFLNTRVPTRVRADSCGLRPHRSDKEKCPFLLSLGNSSLRPRSSRLAEVRKGENFFPFKSTSY